MIVDGIAIARDLGLHPRTLRNWASAGRLTRHGYDRRGRALYDYDDVYQLAIAAGCICNVSRPRAVPSSSCSASPRRRPRP